MGWPAEATVVRLRVVFDRLAAQAGQARLASAAVLSSQLWAAVGALPAAAARLPLLVVVAQQLVLSLLSYPRAASASSSTHQGTTQYLTSQLMAEQPMAMEPPPGRHDQAG